MVARFFFKKEFIIKYFIHVQAFLLVVRYKLLSRFPHKVVPKHSRILHTRIKLLTLKIFVVEKQQLSMGRTAQSNLFKRTFTSLHRLITDKVIAVLKILYICINIIINSNLKKY